MMYLDEDWKGQIRSSFPPTLTFVMLGDDHLWGMWAGVDARSGSFSLTDVSSECRMTGPRNYQVVPWS